MSALAEVKKKSYVPKTFFLKYAPEDIALLEKRGIFVRNGGGEKLDTIQWEDGSKIFFSTPFLRCPFGIKTFSGNSETKTKDAYKLLLNVDSRINEDFIKVFNLIDGFMKEVSKMCVSGTIEENKTEEEEDFSVSYHPILRKQDKYTSMSFSIPIITVMKGGKEELTIDVPIKRLVDRDLVECFHEKEPNEDNVTGFSQFKNLEFFNKHYMNYMFSLNCSLERMWIMKNLAGVQIKVHQIFVIEKRFFEIDCK